MHTIMRLFPIFLFCMGVSVAAGPKALYHLRPGDQVRITVFQEEDMSITTRLDNEGVVDMPLLKPAKIAGLSTEDAQQLLERRMVQEQLLRHPKVLVQVLEFAPQEVSILGEVRTPGKFTLPDDNTPFTIIDLIAKAGGFTDLSNAKHVRITRTEDGVAKTIIVDTTKFIQGKNGKETPPLLQDGDIVNIPQTTF
jgi:polysaccharide export outer membrane protein